MKAFLPHKYRRPCMNAANCFNTKVRLYVISQDTGDSHIIPDTREQDKQISTRGEYPKTAGQGGYDLLKIFSLGFIKA